MPNTKTNNDVVMGRAEQPLNTERGGDAELFCFSKRIQINVSVIKYLITMIKYNNVFHTIAARQSGATPPELIKSPTQCQVQVVISPTHFSVALFITSVNV